MVQETSSYALNRNTNISEMVAGVADGSKITCVKFGVKKYSFGREYNC